MTQTSLALALASSHAAGESERFPLDRIRLQKAVFLLAQRGAESWRDRYRYQPYNWGPYSSDLNSELRMLLDNGVLEQVDVPGSRHGAFRATTEGERRAAEVWSDLTPAEQTFVQRVRSYVTSRSFSDLLREVYAEYPAYASKSLFSG